MSQQDLLGFAPDVTSLRTRSFEKSPHALRTISEAADAVDVPQHVLRFWETKFTQIKPLKRNGGRRFYRPADIEVLQQIKFLLYRQGYTIKGAKKAIDDMAAKGGQFAHWSDAFPPANVNDNTAIDVTIPAPHEDKTIPHVDETTSIHNEEATARVLELKTLRSELLSLRDELAPFIEQRIA